MAPRFLASARRRRRLARLGMAICFAGGLALLVALFPSRSDKAPQHFTSQPPQLVKAGRAVALSAQDRRAIDALLDRFIPAAAARRHPGTAYALATPALRAGSSRADWAQGNIPVSPFPGVIADRSFHGWAVNYSFRNEADLDLLVHAKAGGAVTGVSYDIDVKRIDGRWLVDSVLPRQQYAATALPRTSAAAGGRGSARTAAAPTGGNGHSGIWLIVPAVLLIVPVLALGTAAILRWRKGRAAERLYRAST